tara:strand:+ start:1365 stop:1706 length:342 start_codon:yes stop_codon:yes gene_type:complete
MKTIKQIVAYVLWIAIALLLGICHMFIVLGPRETGTDFLQVIDMVIYNYALVHVGLYVGAIIALVFVLVDAIYLKRKLKNNNKPTLIRLIVLVSLAIIIGIAHYILEKVIDVI